MNTSDTIAFLGIYPGKSGAIAAIDSSRNLLLLADLPLTSDGETLDSWRLLELLKPLEAYTRHLAIEKPICYGLTVCPGGLSALRHLPGGGIHVVLVCPPTYCKE